MTNRNITPERQRSVFVTWIAGCGALMTMLCLSAPANAGIFDLFGGGKVCGCSPSFQPKCCQPVKPVCLSTCYTIPTPVCVCPPQKCCPPEIVVKNCSCIPPIILPPPPCHKPEAPPTCHCEAQPCCVSGCGRANSVIPELVPDPDVHAH